MFITKKTVFFLALVLVFSLNGCAKVGGKSFKNRLAEAARDSDITNWSAVADYAASTQSLQSFKNRLAEAARDSDITNWSAVADYAASKHSL